jgi:hypothetical protein
LSVNRIAEKLAVLHGNPISQQGVTLMAELTNPYDLVIADLEVKRSQIERAIEMMKGLKETIAGITPVVAGSIPYSSPPVNGSHQPFDMEKIASDAFFDLSIGDAAVKFLKMVNRKPQATKTIIEAFERGGLKGKSYASVYGVLNRRQSQEKDVVNVHGDWGLKSWYAKKGTNADLLNETED